MGILPIKTSDGYHSNIDTDHFFDGRISMADAGILQLFSKSM
jgi:hypothetical protein